MPTLIRGIFVALALLPAAFGQVETKPPAKSLDTPPIEPVKATVCEVMKNQDLFNGKMVSLRGHIRIESEDFELPSECSKKPLDGLWLEYARGPKKQPIVWCCGDLESRDPMRVVQNKEFKRFDGYLTAHGKAGQCKNTSCYLYDVTATLIGRFDSVPTVPCPNPEYQCPKDGGFGHLGMSTARLLIQSVSDLEVTLRSNQSSTSKPPLKKGRLR